jgi:hypothetical protein
VTKNKAPHQAKREAHKWRKPTNKYYQETRRKVGEIDAEAASRATIESNVGGDNNKTRADIDEKTPNNKALDDSEGWIWTKPRVDRRVRERTDGNDEWVGVDRDVGGVPLTEKDDWPNTPAQTNTEEDRKYIVEPAQSRALDSEGELIVAISDRPEGELIVAISNRLALNHENKAELKLVPMFNDMTVGAKISTKSKKTQKINTKTKGKRKKKNNKNIYIRNKKHRNKKTKKKVFLNTTHNKEKYNTNIQNNIKSITYHVSPNKLKNTIANSYTYHNKQTILTPKIPSVFWTNFCSF